MARARRSKTRTITRYLPRRRSRSRSKFTLPVAAIAGFTPMVMDSVGDFMSEGPSGFAKTILAKSTGYNVREARFDWYYIRTGLMPVIYGLLVHKLIGGKLGVNRALAQANVPFLRL